MLTRNQLIEALADERIEIAGCPHSSSRKFKAWCDTHVSAASIDLPLGRWLWFFDTRRYAPQRLGQALNIEVSPMCVDPSREEHPFVLADLNKTTEQNPFILEPNGFAIGHAGDYIKLANNIAGQVYTRSTAERWGLDVCKSSGLIKPGYHGPLAIELTNHLGAGVIIRKGGLYTQVAFMEVEPVEVANCSYTTGDAWEPKDLLPKPLV